jgi:hypothetical protein
VQSISGLKAAELLMQAGRLDEAQTVLLALEKGTPDDSEVLFLLGLIAVQQKDYDTAIRRFRKILVREPGVARVQLKVARAFFLKKDWDNAGREFRFGRPVRLNDAGQGCDAVLAMVGRPGDPEVPVLRRAEDAFDVEGQHPLSAPTEIARGLSARVASGREQSRSICPNDPLLGLSRSRPGGDGYGECDPGGRARHLTIEASNESEWRQS